MFKVAIIGGYETGDYARFRAKCIHMLREKGKTEGLMLYSIGDEFLDRFAEEFSLTIATVYTEFGKYGKMALKVRNERLLSECEALLYFDCGIKDYNMLYTMASEKGLNVRKVTI